MPSRNQTESPARTPLISNGIPLTDAGMIHALEHIIPAINILGYEAFLVGGAVRDTLLRRPVNDVDIVTNCPPQLLEQHFTIRADISRNMDITVYLIQSAGYSYEVAQLREKADSPAPSQHLSTQPQGSVRIEKTLPVEANPPLAANPDSTPENSSKPCSKHKPKEISAKQASPRHAIGDFSPLPPPPTLHLLTDDLERRDFTINALALNSQKKLTDPFGGHKDMVDKQIRAVTDADKRFEEDPLRILRGVRFAEQFGFTVEAVTAKAMQRQARKLDHIAPERIQQELEKISRLGGPALSRAIRFMFERDILSVILPEIASLNKFEHAPEHHPEGNVFLHTLACLEACDSTAPEVLFAILCHDLGKRETFAVKKDKPSYPAHDKAALPLIQGMARRLRWSNNLVAHVLFAAEQHMRFHTIPVMAPHKTFALMESPYFATLYTTALCDAKARQEAFNPVAWQAIEQRITSLQHLFMQKESPLRLLEGKRVMSVTGLHAGPLLGAVINKAKIWMLDNSVTSPQSIDQRLRQLAQSMK